MTDIITQIVRLFVNPEMKEAPKPKVAEPPKTTGDLQSELRALCDRVVATQMMSVADSQKYEQLRLEIYKRGQEPIASIKQGKKQ